jgi:hypothetical protein
LVAYNSWRGKEAGVVTLALAVGEKKRQGNAMHVLRVPS